MSNEAGESLLNMLTEDDDYPWRTKVEGMIDAVVTSERQETVERIRRRALPMMGTAPWGIRHMTEHDLMAVLDEESAKRGEA